MGNVGVVDASRLIRYAAEVAVLSRSGRLDRASEIAIVTMSPEARLSEEKLTAESLDARAVELVETADPCRRCPANIRERRREQFCPYGCHAWIDYPIGPLFELLLHVTVRISSKQLDRPEGRLIEFILEHGIDGCTAHALREDRPTERPAFTLRQQAMNWSFDARSGHSVSIDTDQVIEAVFFGGRIDPEVAGFLYRPFFEVMENVADVVSNEPGVKHADKLADLGVAQLRDFGAAVMVAQELGVPLLVDR
jgi:hypothetical protein